MSDPSSHQKVRDLEMSHVAVNNIAETKIGARLLLDTNFRVNNFRTLSLSMWLKQINCLFVITGALCMGTTFSQTTPVAPVLPVIASPQNLERIFGEAEAAFTAKQYDKAVAKLDELLKLLGEGKDAPYEMIYFKIGLAHLLGNKLPQAEAAFQDCITRFPKGEYTSRNYLGLGRVLMLQEPREKKEKAIAALRSAATDSTYRAEAGLWLGQLYTDLGMRDDALKVFNSLIGSDVRTPQQTTAAVEVIRLLADMGKLDNLTAYLDSLADQEGIRNAIAWYTNQIVVRGDELVAAGSYQTALTIYRSVPPRSQILKTQNLSLGEMRKDKKILEASVEADKNKQMNQRSKASELLNALNPAIQLAEEASAAIEKNANFDAAILMRRGRCLFYLNRYEEALLCFRTIRTKYESSSDADAAGYAEIVIFRKMGNVPEMKEKSELFMRKFPDSKNLEHVAGLAGELLLETGNWKEVRNFYRGLETKFPQSENLETYVFSQAVAYFQEGNFVEALKLLEAFVKRFPNSPATENAIYYMAMSYFLSNNADKTLSASREYLTKFPDGRFAGDMQYRLSFIDFANKVDQSEKIIRDLTGFIRMHPDDSSNGSMYCLLADTYKRTKKIDEALDSYMKAVMTDSSNDVIQYAIDSATAILQERKDWAGTAKLHTEFMQRKPDSPLALASAATIAKMLARLGRSAEAATILADSLKARIADPASEQVEFLIDELVKSLVPRKKPADIDADALDKELNAILEKIIVGRENMTTSARTNYARARLSQMLRRNDRSDLYLKEIATRNAENPAPLSPALLVTSGEILLKNGDLDGAQAMFKRLNDRFPESVFFDAGAVGMGYVALARKQPEEALRIFEGVLVNNPGTSRYKETSLGKLEALNALDKFEEVEKLALLIVGDKLFRGESAAKAYMILAQMYRTKSAKAAGAEATELLAKAHGTYQRVYVAYQAFPEVCAEAYWQAHETAKQLGDDKLAQETLTTLATHPKLQNTARAKEAAALIK